MLTELETPGKVVYRFALSRLRLETLFLDRIKNFRGRGRSAGGERFLRLETQGDVTQHFSLFRLRLGTLLSNRIKKFSGAEGNPERRRLPEIRNPGLRGPALCPMSLEVRRPFVESY